MYLTDLAEVLRAAGCDVVEYDGWRSRGRQGVTGGVFEPRAVVLHHDGSPVGPAQPAEAYAHFLFEVGRPSEGIPAPLCNTWVDFYGRWWIGAAGRANHAGEGGPLHGIPANMANSYSLGVEMDNTTDEPTTADQYEALHKGLPAIFKHYGWSVPSGLFSHHEWDPDRKFDPDDIDMSQMRADVAELMAAPPAPPPTEDEDDMPFAMLVVVPPAPRDEMGKVATDENGRPLNATPIAVPPPDAAGGVKFGPVWFSAYGTGRNPLTVWADRSGSDGVVQQVFAGTWFKISDPRTRSDTSARIPGGTHGLTVAHDSELPICVLIEVGKAA